MLRHAVRLNSLTELALTKLDVLDGFDAVQGVHRLPARRAHADVTTPIGPTCWPGSSRSTRRCLAGRTGLGDVREPGDLPAPARALIELVEREVGIPVRVVGVGAERDDYVDLAFPGHAGRGLAARSLALARSQLDATRLPSGHAGARDRALHAPEMAAVWADTTRFARWLEVELLATEAHAALGVVPAADARACRERAPEVDDAFVAAVLERERTTDHDVAAFVDVVQERIGAPGSWIHYGLTSSTSSTRRCAGRCATPPTSCSTASTS